MSWHMNTCGTKAEVTAAIDEATAAPSGMPKAVGDYLRDVVESTDLVEGATDGVERYLVHVESTGHRPMNGSGAKETCTVTKVRRGAWNPPKAG